MGSKIKPATCRHTIAVSVVDKTQTRLAAENVKIMRGMKSK